MNVIKYLKILLIFTSCLMSQTFTGVSENVSLTITREAFLDSIAPVISIYSLVPNIIPNKPIYSQDSIITITGKASDNKDYIKLFVNNKPTPIVDSNFSAKVKLKHGLNLVNVKGIDRNKNISLKSAEVYFDEYADLDKPEINILNPRAYVRGIKVSEKEENKNEIGEDSTIVRIQVFDDSGIYEVKLNDQKMSFLGNSEYEFNFESKLPDTLLFTAIDEFGNKAIKTTYLNPKKKQENFTDQIFAGEYYGLIVANKDYKDKNIPSLANPIKDAEKLKKILIEEYNFKSDNIIFLTNATRYEIFSAFNSLRKEINPNDNLLIFYAGHGSFNENMEQGFWLPSDASNDNESNWISNSDIRDRIRSIDVKHTLLIADACFSGGIFQSRSFYNVSPSIKQTYESKSRKAITSGYLDFVPDKSVFIEYLIKRLKDNANEYLTASTLYTMMKDAVTNNSQNNQTPIYGTILRAGDEGGYGDFVFIKKSTN